MKEREDELWQYFDGTVIMAGPTFTVLPTLMTEWLFSIFTSLGFKVTSFV